MNALHRVLVFFLACATLTVGRAQSPRPPFALALTLNDGTSEVVYAGWPLIVAADAVLMEEVATAFTLDPASVRLVIQTSEGAATTWPLRRIETTSANQLGPANDTVRIRWVLTAEAAAALNPGAYSAKFSWAGRNAPALEFRVEPAPVAPSPEQRIRRALLQSQVLLLGRDLDGALAAVAPLVEQEPARIDLLVQQSRVQLARGDSRAAFHSAQRALAVYYDRNPTSPHPPASILAVESAARAALFKNVTPGPRPPGVPGGPPRTVSTPSAVPAPAGVAATPAVPAATPASPQAAVAAARSEELPTGVVVPAGELQDATVRRDPAGQWAAAARAGSSYSNPGYAAAKATLEPNVAVAGDSPEAWCPGRQNDGSEWLEVSFARPVPAVGVRIRQSHTPGAIVKVEAYEPDGKSHLWWEGRDPQVAPEVRGIAWFAIKLPATTYAVAKVKLTLNLAAVPGWKQIDAVQLVAAPAP